MAEIIERPILNAPLIPYQTLLPDWCLEALNGFDAQAETGQLYGQWVNLVHKISLCQLFDIWEKAGISTHSSRQAVDIIFMWINCGRAEKVKVITNSLRQGIYRWGDQGYA